MRITPDTSILVRATGTSRGLARELLLTMTEQDHVLVLSNEMLHEVAKVLRYPRMLALHELTEARIYEFIGYLRERAEITTLNPLLNAPIRDLNDVIVMQTAILGEAEIICTRDEDFFTPPASVFLNQLGITVVDDIALMQRLRS